MELPVPPEDELWLFVDTVTGLPVKPEMHNERWHRVRKWVDENDPDNAWPRTIVYRNLRDHAATRWFHDELGEPWEVVAQYLGDKLTTAITSPTAHRPSLPLSRRRPRLSLLRLPRAFMAVGAHRRTIHSVTTPPFAAQSRIGTLAALENFAIDRQVSMHLMCHIRTDIGTLVTLEVQDVLPTDLARARVRQPRRRHSR